MDVCGFVHSLRYVVDEDINVHLLPDYHCAQFSYVEVQQ